MQSLVLCEVSKKQDYIFKSNKLKENIGASLIIKEITESLSDEFKSYAGKRIMNGGGKSLYKFQNTDESKLFIKKFSKYILEKYPGIEIFMVHKEYDENNKDAMCKDIMCAVKDAYAALEKKKEERKHSGRQYSFGFEEKCYSTGLPASKHCKEYDEERFLSPEIEAKIVKCNQSRKDDYKEIVPEKYLNEIKISSAVEDIVDSEKSYIAVVHIDGNNMGKKFNEFNGLMKKKDNENYKMHNDKFVSSLNAFSTNVDKAYKEAFKSMYEKVYEHWKGICKSEKICSPIIPLIFAGDDVTYIINAKLGIESAKIFLENLKTINMTDEIKVKLTACAGISIVKKNYPFARAYRLAEDLCSNAKKTMKKDYEDVEYSLIDWHAEQGDIAGSIDEIRSKMYITDENAKIKLNIRPLYIENNEKWNNYNNFIKIIDEINEKDKNNQNVIPRSKLKTLREMLRQGPKATEMYIKLYLKDKNGKSPLSSFKDEGEYCFRNADQSCMYFDAIEINDLFEKIE